MRNILNLSLKTYMAALLIVLALVGAVTQGVRFVYLQLCVAVSAAMLLDLILTYARTKQIRVSSSAFISGIIIAMVLSPQSRWFVPLTASIAAIAQKHIIRFDGRHIFNPANFGLLFVMFLFSAQPSWWGQSYWPILVLGGIFICYKMKRLTIVIVFIASASLLFNIDSILVAHRSVDPLIFVNLFFTFVMLVEPRTSPSARKGQYFYAAAAAIFIFIFYKICPRYDFSIMALFFANAFISILNKMK